MQKCKSCYHVFEDDEVEIYTETHGLDSPPYEEFPCCPHCGSEYISEAGQCSKCEKYEFFENIEENLCWECQEEVSRKWKSFKEELTLEEIDYIMVNY